jgi:hypothetical protein
MNTQNTKTQEIKKGDFILVWDGVSTYVKRKVLFIEKALNGDTCYIVNFKYGSRTTTGVVYQREIKNIY